MTGRIVACLVAEGALEDQDLLAEVMRMCTETGSRLVANDRSRAATSPPVRSSMRRSTPASGLSGPRQILMSQDDSSAVVRIDEHRSFA
jgi:Arc/MetJ family transcription regulator